MRTSILNTAITEQMGYGIVSFFVYFLSLGSVSIVLTALNHHFSKKFASQKPHISAVFAGF